MTQRIQLTIKYKNGNELKELVNYIYFEAGAIYFVKDSQIHSAIQEPIRVTLANVEHFYVNNVTCDGWTVVGEE